jgi:hypothetical protein
VFIDDRLDDLHDARELDLPFEERHHGDLVRGVHHRGEREAEAADAVGEVDGRERLVIDRLEGERRLRERQRGHARRETFRPCQGELDGQAHVGRGHLGPHRSVAELGDRVHHALGMDQHVDLRVLEPEEVVGFDHLEALVHHRRGVDRDLRSHRPDRMLERFLHRRLRELRRRPAAEGATGSGDHHAFQVFPALPAERHGKCGVLGIHRQEAFRLAFDQVEHQLAAHDQRFLVREGHRLSVLERCQRGPETRGAHERVQDDVGLGLGGESLRGVRTAADVHPSQ